MAAPQANNINNNKNKTIPVEFNWSYGGKQVILTGIQVLIKHHIVSSPLISSRAS